MSNRAVERERLEAELRAQMQEARASEQRLRDVLEGVYLVAVSTDLEGRIRFCNRYLCELSGWTREELIGRSWAETFNPRSTIVEQTAAGRVSHHEEAPLRTRSGEHRESGHSARVDDYSNVEGEFAAMIRSLGIDGSVATPISVGGDLWGAIVVSTTRDAPLTPDAEAHLEEFAELLALGLASAEARREVAASRARIVAAGDAERRRLERNLHDGAQQQLVTLSLALRMARSRLDESDDAAPILDAASEQLMEALAELRELARGIHPAILTDRGLHAAVEALAARCPVPVEVSIDLPHELSNEVEATAYYVVAEGLTNIAKYADAGQARVCVNHADAQLTVEVADDGVGGADRALGSGLRGLADRVSALGGRLRVVSPAGGGTTVTADLPTAEM